MNSENSYEMEVAEFESARNSCLDSYFKARPELKSTLEIERFLEAGFRLAWEYCKNKGENNEP